MRSNGPLENNTSQLKHKKSSKKGKEKCNDNAIGDSNGTFVDSIAKSTRELQLNHKLSGSNGLTNLISSNQTLLGMSVQAPSQPTADGSKKSQGTKPRKKTSKFHRVRLGESSSAAVLDLVNSDGCPDQLKGNPMTILVVTQRRCQFEEFGKWGRPETSWQIGHDQMSTQNFVRIV